MGHSSNPAVIVVSPLIALMSEQVTSLREKGIAAAQIGLSDAENYAVISGQATVIYGSPEMLLDNDLWRRTVAGPSVKPRLAALVDEVHTVAQWYIYIYFLFFVFSDIVSPFRGMKSGAKQPFRVFSEKLANFEA